MYREMVYWTFGFLAGAAGSYVPDTWSGLAKVGIAFVLGAGRVWIANLISDVLRRE